MQRAPALRNPSAAPRAPRMSRPMPVGMPLLPAFTRTELMPVIG